MQKTFDSTIRCSLAELYNCGSVDGFDDLIEEKLGHGIADADWEVVGTDVQKMIVLRVWGQVFSDEEGETVEE